MNLSKPYYRIARPKAFIPSYVKDIRYAPERLQLSRSYTKEVRKGIAQIRDWKQWMDNSREHFLRENGFLEKGIDIPSYMIHYYLVVSRRERMDKRAINLRNQMCSEKNTKIVSYDRLIDNMWNLEYGY